MSAVPGGDVTTVAVSLDSATGKSCAWTVRVRRAGSDVFQRTTVTADSLPQACDAARAIGSVPLTVKFEKTSMTSSVARF